MLDYTSLVFFSLWIAWSQYFWTDDLIIIIDPSNVGITMLFLLPTLGRNRNRRVSPKYTEGTIKIFPNHGSSSCCQLIEFWPSTYLFKIQKIWWETPVPSQKGQIINPSEHTEQFFKLFTPHDGHFIKHFAWHSWHISSGCSNKCCTGVEWNQLILWKFWINKHLLYFFTSFCRKLISYHLFIF